MKTFSMDGEKVGNLAELVWEIPARILYQKLSVVQCLSRVSDGCGVGQPWTSAISNNFAGLDSLWLIFLNFLRQVQTLSFMLWFPASSVSLNLPWCYFQFMRKQSNISNSRILIGCQIPRIYSVFLLLLLLFILFSFIYLFI